jgi:hypothetical protein
MNLEQLHRMQNWIRNFIDARHEESTLTPCLLDPDKKDSG